MPNLAALRAVIFFAICEKPMGGGTYVPPPPPGRAQASHVGTYWHQSHQLPPFKSHHAKLRFLTISLEFCRRLFLLWCHNFVTWPDLTNFPHQNLRKRCPISYGKFQHDTPNGAASAPIAQSGERCIDELTGSESPVRAASALAVCSWLGLPAVGGSGGTQGKLTSVERGGPCPAM